MRALLLLLCAILGLAVCARAACPSDLQFEVDELCYTCANCTAEGFFLTVDDNLISTPVVPTECTLFRNDAGDIPTNILSLTIEQIDGNDYNVTIYNTIECNEETFVATESVVLGGECETVGPVEICLLDETYGYTSALCTATSDTVCTDVPTCPTAGQFVYPNTTAGTCIECQDCGDENYLVIFAPTFLDTLFVTFGALEINETACLFVASMGSANNYVRVTLNETDSLHARFPYSDDECTVLTTPVGGIPPFNRDLEPRDCIDASESCWQIMAETHSVRQCSVAGHTQALCSLCEAGTFTAPTQNSTNYACLGCSTCAAPYEVAIESALFDEPLYFYGEPDCYLLPTGEHSFAFEVNTTFNNGTVIFYDSDTCSSIDVEAAFNLSQPVTVEFLGEEFVITISVNENHVMVSNCTIAANTQCSTGGGQNMTGLGLGLGLGLGIPVLAVVIFIAFKFFSGASSSAAGYSVVSSG